MIKRYQARGVVYSLSEEKFLEFFQKAFKGMRLSRAFVTHKESKTYQSIDKRTIVFDDECTIDLSNVSGKELYTFLTNQKTIEEDLLGKYKISTFTNNQSLVVDDCNYRQKTCPVVFSSRTEKDWSPYTAEGREKIYEKIKSVLDEEKKSLSALSAGFEFQPFSTSINRYYQSTLISDSDNEIHFKFSFASDACILKLSTIFEVGDDFKYDKNQLNAIGRGRLEDLPSRFVKDLEIDLVEIREDGYFID